MTTQDWNRYVSVSGYKRATDIKKLRYIYDCVHRYAEAKSSDVKDLDVLEIGCGKGDISLPLASLGCKVTAFDIDPDEVDRLKQSAKKAGIDSISAFAGDANSFAADKQYDLIVISEVIAYVGEPSRLLANLTEIVKPGSYVVVTQPNGYGPYEMMNRARNFSWPSRFLKRILKKRVFKGSYRWYTKRQLEEMFARYSMSLVYAGKSDYVSSFLAGPLKNSTLLAKLDCSIADRLPFWAVSGWYLLFENTPAKGADE